MLAVGNKVLLVGSVLLFCGVLSNPAQAAQKHHPSKKSVVKQEQPAPPPQPAAPPPAPTQQTLEKMPATPARVSYQNNQLSIIAQNSTLSDILRSVHTKTGAAVDAPPNANERVVGQFG